MALREAYVYGGTGTTIGEWRCEYISFNSSTCMVQAEALCVTVP